METLKGLKRTHYCGDLRMDNVGEEVILNGWVQKKRNLGGLIFIDLRDRSGIIQLVIKPESSFYSLAESLKSEYVIEATGKVIERENKNKNFIRNLFSSFSMDYFF